MPWRWFCAIDGMQKVRIYVGTDLVLWDFGRCEATIGVMLTYAGIARHL